MHLLCYNWKLRMVELIHPTVSLIIHCDLAVGSYTLVTPICDVSSRMFPRANASHYTKQFIWAFGVNYVI